MDFGLLWHFVLMLQQFIADRQMPATGECFSQAMTPVRLCVSSGIKVQKDIVEFLLPIIVEAVNFGPGILLCELSGFICRLFF